MIAKRELKLKAISLRKEGLSLKKIREENDIPLSTLSGWMKDVPLSPEQQEKLRKDWENGLVEARKKAASWHNSQKQTRLEKAEKEASAVINGIDTNDKSSLELALAFLYLGEGAKNKTLTLPNSNPNILLFYILAIETLYDIRRENLTYHLHLRADQNEHDCKKYWCETLHIPLERITYCVFDKRTEGRKTYDSYKGVCLVIGGGIHIQRRLLEISRLYSNMILA
jgi:hypothetical protein